jgi:hypothetical protein
MLEILIVGRESKRDRMIGRVDSGDYEFVVTTNNNVLCHKREYPAQIDISPSALVEVFPNHSPDNLKSLPVLFGKRVDDIYR